MTPQPELSVIIISFNTRNMTRDCLNTLKRDLEDIPSEIFVVDNASRDASAEMIAEEFPDVILIRTDVNLGFGGANNLALHRATGRYIVLLNSDAFPAPGAMRLSIQHMDANPQCGLGGARLIGREGEWQPSARAFHSITADAFTYTGLSGRYPQSKFFARLDETWADQLAPRKVDWVPGAYSIIRPEALQKAGPFDLRFFLYYEEVDLCMRIKQAGYDIWYWPDIVITHIGGESSRQLKHLDFSSKASQVTKWRMRSTLLYYRKHHGAKAYLAKMLEEVLYTFSMWRNRISSNSERKTRATHFAVLREMMRKAWAETNGGRVSPPAPW